MTSKRGHVLSFRATILANHPLRVVVVADMVSQTGFCGVERALTVLERAAKRVVGANTVICNHVRFKVRCNEVGFVTQLAGVQLPIFLVHFKMSPKGSVLQEYFLTMLAFVLFWFSDFLRIFEFFPF